MNNDNGLQCFIISKFSLNDSKIREIIKEKLIENYSIKTWDGYSQPIEYGTNLFDDIEKRMKDSDFIVAVISDESPYVLFELGLAFGLGKPVFIILTGDKKLIPSDIPFTYVKYKPDDLDSFKFSFETFIESILSKKKIGRKKQKINDKKQKEMNFESAVLALRHKDPEIRKNAVKVLGDIGNERAIEQLKFAINDMNWNVRKTVKNQLKRFNILTSSDYYKKLGQLRERGNEIDIQKLIATIFIDMGIVFKESPIMEKNIRPDFSLWLDSLEGVFGNPILIEIKIGSLTEKKLLFAEKQLYSNLIKTNAKAGIILYLDRGDKKFPIKTFFQSNIIRIEISDLINSLNELTLEEILLRERNRLAHLRDD